MTMLRNVQCKALDRQPRSTISWPKGRNRNDAECDDPSVYAATNRFTCVKFPWQCSLRAII